jgi:hypothetical protein
MKKISIASLASFIFLMCASAVALISKFIFKDALTSLIVGGIILLMSGILAFVMKDKTPTNIVCFFISSIAMGLFIRSWYILRGLENGIGTMALVSLSLVLYLWLFFAFTRIPLIRHSKTAFIIFSILFVAASIGIYVFLVSNTNTTYLSTIGYYAIIELGFIFAMSLEAHTREDLIRNLALSTYSVLIVGIIVAVFLVIALLGGDGLDCDCDCGGDCCCDSCDIGGDLPSTKKKKKGKI